MTSDWITSKICDSIFCDIWSETQHHEQHLSLCVRKPTICMGENKDADQLRGNREADQRLCFRYTDNTFPPLLIPKFSRFWVSSVTVQAGLCQTWSETQIVGFLMHRLISFDWLMLRSYMACDTFLEKHCILDVSS